jgi:hypothetical protein
MLFLYLKGYDGYDQRIQIITQDEFSLARMQFLGYPCPSSNAFFI